MRHELPLVPSVDNRDRKHSRQGPRDSIKSAKGVASEIILGYCFQSASRIAGSDL